VEEEPMCGAGDEGVEMEEEEEEEEGEARGEGGAEGEWGVAPGFHVPQISGREASFQRIPEFNAPPTASVALEIDHAPQTYAHKVLRVELGFS
jgi:hypothetical protein